MNSLCIDFGYTSINHVDEQLCGDMVEYIQRDDNSVVTVLADGLGSGVKANILSTLTSKIISTMMANNMTLEDCVATIASTLPVCSTRGVAYSTFTIVKINNNTEAELIQYDNPHVIMLRNGVHYDYPMQKKVVEGKEIYESKIKLQLDDIFISMSDGAIWAGVGMSMNFGWQRENIIEFIEANYAAELSAKSISSLIVDQCNALYGGRPGDDTTISVVKLRSRKPCNLLMGPPRDPSDVNKMMALFFAKEGRHIVCGGTTSSLAAKYLGKEVQAGLEYLDPDVPPAAKIDGVDLVTECVITISKVLEYAKNYLEDNSLYEKWSCKRDAASQIARLLFEEATDINFYVGRAINPAHQNPDLPITFSIKIRLIEELAECLKKMGKAIKVSFF